MNYAIEHIAQRLKEARERKGLSQRALSKLAGMPQSHISKIENGGVDLRVSSLVELARVLDLELALVPRKSVSAVRAVSQDMEPRHDLAASDRQLFRQLSEYLEDAIQAYPDSKEVAQAQRLAREVRHFHLNKEYRDALRYAIKTLKNYREQARPEELRGSLAALQDVRNSLAHSVELKGTGRVRPAYSLEEDGDG